MSNVVLIAVCSTRFGRDLAVRLSESGDAVVATTSDREILSQFSGLRCLLVGIDSVRERGCSPQRRVRAQKTPETPAIQVHTVSGLEGWCKPCWKVFMNVGIKHENQANNTISRQPQSAHAAR